MLESINDLPAHVFFIHAPVVLVPLIALMSLVIAIRPRWRVTYAPLLAMAALVAFVSTFLAKESGEAFDEILDGQVDVSRHQELGNQTTIMVFVLALLTVVAAVLSRRSAGEGPPSGDTTTDAAGPLAPRAIAPSTASTASTAMSIAIVAVSALATLWMARTGDEGAKLVWDGVVGR